LLFFSILTLIALNFKTQSPTFARTAMRAFFDFFRRPLTLSQVLWLGLDRRSVRDIVLVACGCVLLGVGVSVALSGHSASPVAAQTPTTNAVAPSSGRPRQPWQIDIGEGLLALAIGGVSLARRRSLNRGDRAGRRQ
jgi:hypothetical protein